MGQRGQYNTAEISQAADELRRAGVEPVAISGDSVNVDSVYVVVLSTNEPKPWSLKKWTQLGTILKEVGAFETAGDAVDRYMLDMKYKIN